MGLLFPLREARFDGKSLPDLVEANLTHLWKTGGARGATKNGLQPAEIHVRRNMVFRPSLMDSNDPDSPPNEAAPGTDEGVVQRLIKSRGLQLRLELLLLFDAQCRYEAGTRVGNVRKLQQPTDDDRFVDWCQLVLAGAKPQEGGGRTARDLRQRQITEALRVLQAEHLVHLPTDPAGRRKYNDFHLLSETGTRAHTRYTVPDGFTRKPFEIPRQFFTNLWIFALTDTEIATYLMLCLLRARFRRSHDSKGVHAVNGDRLEAFGLTRTAYRSHSMLHLFRLIDRLPNPDRSFASGKVHGFATKYARGKGSVQAHHFKINDAALDRPALETIEQVLARPTPDDLFRQATGADLPEIPGVVALPEFFGISSGTA